MLILFHVGLKYYMLFQYILLSCFNEGHIRISAIVVLNALTGVFIENYKFSDVKEMGFLTMMSRNQEIF